MRISYQMRVFLGLTAALLAASFVVGWFRWHGHGPEREAWAAIEADLVGQSARIDSLEAVLAIRDSVLSLAKRDVARANERLKHFERQAESGRLPSEAYRHYMQEIERQNAAVARHNRELAGMQRIYREYSALVDTHNALVDSANSLQRRAVQEGFQLQRGQEPEAEPR